MNKARTEIRVNEIVNARSVTVAGKGHNATMTAPGFVEQVARFLLRDAMR